MKFVGLSMRFRYFVQNLRRFGPKKMFQYFLFQRILRINSETPWPVHWSSVVSFPRNIHLDSPTANLGAMPGCYIQAQNGIQVGKNTIVGPGVKIISGNHNLYNFRVHEPKEPITIGENCWIGANAVILPGVKLGRIAINPLFHQGFALSFLHCCAASFLNSFLWGFLLDFPESYRSAACAWRVRSWRRLKSMQEKVFLTRTLATVVTMRCPASNTRFIQANGRSTSDRVLLMALFRRFSLIDNG